MSRKEELQAALDKLDNLRRGVQEKLDEIIDAERPKVGDVAMIWHEDEECFVIGKVTDSERRGHVIVGDLFSSWNSRKVTKEEVIDLLFGKEEDNE